MSNKTLTIRKLTLGGGQPKICVPIMAAGTEELLWEAVLAKTAGADLVEWRADYFEDSQSTAGLLRAAKSLRAALQDTPLLFTFRSREEGGQRALETGAYFNLNREIAASTWVDLVDIELSRGDEKVETFAQEARAAGARVVVSSHNFSSTPPREAMLTCLKRMRALGADIPKLAVMPQNFADVLALMAATETFSQEADCPVITMSMGKLGQLSRIAGRFTGSALTFGTTGENSAPGQLPVEALRQILNALDS